MTHAPEPSYGVPLGGPGASPSVAPSASTTTPDDRSTAFRAVEGGAETVPGGSLLIAAYAVIWVVVLLLVVRIFTRQSAAARELARLEESIRDEASRGGGAKASRARGVGLPEEQVR